MDTLPDELRLQILSYLAPRDLWHSVRHINTQYQKYTDEIATKQHIPEFTVSLTFTLGGGSSHRWYDVHGTIHTSFHSINKLNPQYALFEVTEVLPKASRERVMAKWKQMCASGFGPEQEWRVKFGVDGLLVKLPNLVVSGSDRVWCDWREMLDGYIRRWPEAWEGYARVH